MTDALVEIEEKLAENVRLSYFIDTSTYPTHHQKETLNCKCQMLPVNVFVALRYTCNPMFKIF